MSMGIALLFASCEKSEVFERSKVLEQTEANAVTRAPAQNFDIRVVDWNQVYQYSVWGGSHGDIDISLPAGLTGNYIIGGTVFAVELTNGGWAIFVTAGGSGCSVTMSATAPTPSGTAIMSFVMIDASAGIAIAQVKSNGDVITFYAQ
ncbi:MAG: hypothetical protein LBR70_02770 [Lactobacillaceae bacterium]|nr:hypothetical protein [Lactobacillaceae bacterium]